MLNGQKEKTKELGTRNALNTNSKYISTHVKKDSKNSENFSLYKLQTYRCMWLTYDVEYYN